MILSNFLCASAVALYVIDVVLVLLIAATLVIMFFKPSKKADKTVSDLNSEQDLSQNNNDSPKIVSETEQNTLVEEIDAVIAPVVEENIVQTPQTEEIEYVIAPREPEKKQVKTKHNKPKTAVKPSAPSINRIEYFTNQISGLNEEYNNEINSKVTFTPRQTNKPIKRVVMQEVVNISEKPTTQIKVSSYVDSNALLNTIKEQQSETTPKKESKQKNAAAKSTTTKKQNTSSKTVAKAKDEAPKRKYTKRKKDEN